MIACLVTSNEGSRDIYEQTFDEDVALADQTTCPECEGLVTTNTHGTICEECGLVLDDQQINHGPEWREFDDGRTEPATDGFAEHGRSSRPRNSSSPPSIGACRHSGFELLRGVELSVATGLSVKDGRDSRVDLEAPPTRRPGDPETRRPGDP
jgi:hypothetical protein